MAFTHLYYTPFAAIGRICGIMMERLGLNLKLVRLSMSIDTHDKYGLRLIAHA
jgi:hypothetical protein